MGWHSPSLPERTGAPGGISCGSGTAAERERQAGEPSHPKDVSSGQVHVDSILGAKVQWNLSGHAIVCGHGLRASGNRVFVQNEDRTFWGIRSKIMD